MKQRPSLVVLVLRVLGVLAVSLLLGGRPAAAQEKTFSLDALTTNAVVRADGSMAVTEQITYSFSGGPFTIGTRSFLDEDRSRIRNFQVSENGTQLQVDPPSDTPTGEWEWHFALPVSDETHTYTITYDVPLAVTIGSDVGELYWMFLGEDHPGVGAVDITVDLPGTFTVAAPDSPDTEADVLRAWGHGPRTGSVSLTPSAVHLAVSPVPAGDFVEARIAVPADAFTGDARTGPRLATILDEEGAFVDTTLAEDKGRTIGPPPSGLARAVGPLGALVGLAGAAGLWARYGREPKPDPLVGEYWREPLTDPPVVAMANMDRSTPGLGTAIGATIIDLAQRGHLTIREEKLERFGPDKTITHLTRTGRTDGDLEPFEQRLLSYVFSSGAETTTDEITDRAKANQSTATAFASGFQTDMGTAIAARSYRQSGHKGWGKLAVLAGVSGLAGVGGMAGGSALGFVGFGGAAATLAVGGAGLRNRSQTGADAAAKAEGLKKYIQDFSNLQDAPAGHLILWERFLVYAVAFGVSRELLNGLALRLPSVLQDPNYGIWYLGVNPHRRFDTIDRFPSSFGATTAAAVAPSKSGSGGGFSGGGGGGGGGGGFGAR